MTAVDERSFLQALHAAETADKWGWTEHHVGKYTVQTNGTTWNAFHSISGKRVALNRVVEDES